MSIIMIGGVGILLFIFFFIAVRNGLIGKKNDAENAFSSVDVQLKQRHDLIPNLVATVKEAMSHERGTLEKLVELRGQAMKPNLPANESVGIENQITRHLSGILVAVESYPQLKANENVLSLQRSLNEVEAQIAAARRTFNASVTEYNNGIEMFPSSIVASMMGYRRRDLFLAAESERVNSNVGNLFKH